ncbi:copper-containing nitrite reductase [Candidatus Ferrigenium straubiae]|jgi:nitrite reductase (NO-forming)|uniref:copper-containing nitrite reductase n=1 Tax=Candidatus Ferrigenium straubiae TaxID=2919506 RepID=UPI003F4A9B33
MKVKGIIGALSLGLLAFGTSASWAADVAATAPVSVAGAVDIHQDPTAVGTPVGKREPTTLKMALEAVELEGILDPAKKTTFTYWTYNSKVPGPMLRARVGDTVEITLSNRKDSTVTHNVDLHAVWGQGGGAAATVVAPGETKSFVFKAMNPGLYVYHCATPIIPQHISSGMYGLILIEPAGGLPKVDKEFYMMQGEIYTDGAATGHRAFDVPSMLAEHPTDVVINGSRMALANSPMKVKVGDNVRVFFGVGGPNLTSAYHAIGTVFDKVWNEGTTGAPLQNVQTTVVPPGGSAMVEFKARVPAKYIFVDHALSRFAKGNAAIMIAEGDEQPNVFRTGKLEDAKKK